MILYDDIHTPSKDELVAMYDDQSSDYTSLLERYLEDQAIMLEDYLTQLEQDNDYLVTADLGLWYGRRSGSTIIHNLKDLYKYLEDYSTIELTPDALKITTCHHDGTNYYEIKPHRKWKYNI